MTYTSRYYFAQALRRALKDGTLAAYYKRALGVRVAYLSDDEVFRYVPRAIVEGRQ